MRAFYEFVGRYRARFASLSTLALACLIVVSASTEEGSLVAPFLFLSGLVLIGIATVGRLWCALYISGRKGSELVVAGPYSMTRNPLYFFSSLGYLGVGLATETVAIPVIVLLVFAVTYPGLVSAEEARLRDVFGPAFEDYCARTPRFFPRFGTYCEPDAWVVNPSAFRRTMFNALSFIWLAGLIELVEALHDLGLVTPLMHLP